MVLYFNTKLTSAPLINQQLDHDYFYPVVYPKRETVFDKASSFEVLIKTIESYSVIEFSVVIFNIEIDLDIPNYDEIISELINRRFSQSKIILKFNRPSTIKDWINDINSYKGVSSFNEAVFVVMNHDHPFVDYQTSTFSEVVNTVFTELNNFKKVLYYSHSPEILSWIYNGRGLTKFKSISTNLYVSSVVDNWIDSIGIMTFDTLLHIWQKAKFSGNYIGRIDWEGVKYDNLELSTYAYPREFCKHYDGYNHITGLRLDNEMTSATPLPYQFPSLEDNNALLDFYYKRWIDISFLLIRDFLLQKDNIFGVEKQSLVDVIELSLNSFFDTYLENDVKANLIEPNIVIRLKSGLRNQIYFNANSIFNDMITDVRLKRPFTLKRILFSKLRDILFSFRKPVYNQ